MSLSEADNDKPVPSKSNSQKSTPTLIQAPLNKTVTGATSLISRTTADNLGGTTGPTTLMVLTTSSMASTNQNGALNIASSNPGTLAVKTATSAGGIGGAKTIVVMPVSNNFASGDGATAKRFKIE